VKDIGLLHDVLGLAVVAKNAAGDAVKPAVVPQRDRPHGSLIAQTRPNQQFLIAETFWLVWQWNWMHAGFPDQITGDWMQPRAKGSREKRYSAVHRPPS
jgi:hypothetical protein